VYLTRLLLGNDRENEYCTIHSPIRQHWYSCSPRPENPRTDIASGCDRNFISLTGSQRGWLVNGGRQKSGVGGRGRTQLKLREYVFFFFKLLSGPKLLLILSIFRQKFTVADLHANLHVGIYVCT